MDSACTQIPMEENVSKYDLAFKANKLKVNQKKI